MTSKNGQDPAKRYLPEKKPGIHRHKWKVKERIGTVVTYECTVKDCKKTKTRLKGS